MRHAAEGQRPISYSTRKQSEAMNILLASADKRTKDLSRVGDMLISNPKLQVLSSSNKSISYHSRASSNCHDKFSGAGSNSKASRSRYSRSTFNNEAHRRHGAAQGSDQFERASRSTTLQEKLDRKDAQRRTLRQMNDRRPQQLMLETFQSQLPNDNKNYSLSPAAKRALQDGSLNPMMAQTFTRTFNRRLKMRDTFTKVFPNYTHAEPTCYQPGHAHSTHVYFETNPETGRPMHHIDRKYTHKRDQMKLYHESILKVASMRRQF